jgi:hypothetical protein
MESQLLGAAREIPSLSVASLHGEIRREVRDAASWVKKLENRPAWTKAPCYRGLAAALEAASRRGGVLGFAARLFGDGLGVDQPLSGARTAGLPTLNSGEAPDTDEAADFGAGGIQYGGNLLRGKPTAVRIVIVPPRWRWECKGYSRSCCTTRFLIKRINNVARLCNSF